MGAAKVHAVQMQVQNQLSNGGINDTPILFFLFILHGSPDPFALLTPLLS